VSRRALISPRARPAALGDLGERSTLVGRQRAGRARRRRSRPVAWLGAVALGATLAAVGAGLFAGWTWLVTSPRFAVAAVDVRGAARVGPARVLAAAGIEPGAGLLTLDVREVRARIEAMPEIRRADVVRELPDRVTILVEERRPFTLVHAGRLHWVDEEGYPLGAETRAVATDVPLISGLTEQELATMRTAPGPRARAAIALIRTLLRSGSPLAAEIAEIDVSRPEGPVLWTVDGLEVRLGQEDWEERLARLEGVLAQVATRDVTTVDLRFRDQVVLRRSAP
jgi:cell division septal protein FtsQ